MAYVVGLIATDGNLSRERFCISVASKDADLLETVRRCLNLTNRITPYTGKRCYHIQWRDRVFHDWLIRLGLTPAKSLTLGPITVPSEYFADFFRGCIDGDGTILVYTDRYNTAKKSQYVYERLYVSLVSGSRAFVDWLRAELNRLVGVAGDIHERRKPNRAPLWRLRYAKADSIRLIRWMYYSPDVPCLGRKRAKAERFLQPLGHSRRPHVGRPRAGWLYNEPVTRPSIQRERGGGVAKLATAIDSKSIARKGLGVRVPSPLPTNSLP